MWDKKDDRRRADLGTKSSIISNSRILEIFEKLTFSQVRGKVAVKHDLVESDIIANLV